MSKVGAEDDEEERDDVVECGARSQRSIKGELYYVSCSRISISAGGLESEDGRRIEFCKCRMTKAKRTLIVLASLALLDLALSTALPEFRLAVHCLFISLLCLYLTVSFIFSIYKEEVVVVKGLGVHVSSTSWVGLSSSIFLPHTIVGDIIINEGVTMCRVVFYLAVTIVRSKEPTDTHSQKIIKLYPLFTEFNPRLSVIQESYHFLRHHCFHEPSPPSSSPRQPLPSQP